MTEVSVLRLYVLRFGYLIMSVGLAFTIWPQILEHESKWPLWYGVGCSLLAAVSVLAVLGIRYPLKMLPLMFFELVWKSIWFIAVGLPMWSSGQMNPDTLETAINCSLGVIFLFIIPWGYVVSHYVKMPGDRWQ